MLSSNSFRRWVYGVLLSVILATTGLIASSINPTAGILQSHSGAIQPAAAKGFVLISHTQGAPTGTSGVTSPMFDATGANLIVVNVEGVTPFTVMDSQGNVYTGTTACGESQIFYVLGPSVTSTMTVTLTGLVSNLQVESWSGAGSFDKQNCANGTQPGAVTPANANSLLVTGTAGQFMVTWTIDLGFTITDQFPGSGVAVPGGMAYLLQSTPASTNPTWTPTGGAGQWNSIVVFSP